MSKVILENGVPFVAASKVSVFGTTGNDIVKVLDFAGTEVTSDASIERVEFARPSTGYTYKATSTGVQVLLNGTVVTNLVNGQKLAFTDGSATVTTEFNPATASVVVKLGGVVVPTTAGAVAFTPNNGAGEASTITTGSGGTGSTAGQSFSLTTGSTDAPVMTAGNDTVTGALGTIQDGDRLIDSSTLDNDVANLTLNVATAKPQIISVETLNVTGEYTTTGFDFTNAIGVKTANFAAGISGATVTASNVSAVRVAEIKAGANVGTLTVSSDAGGTGTAVKVDTGSAATVTVGALAGNPNTGNDVYDITLGAAATSLTLEANGNSAASAADAFTVQLSGNTLAFNADAGQIETLTLKSSVAANTLTLTGQLVDKTATTSKAVITGDKSLTIKGTLAYIDGVKVEDTTTAGTTTYTTNATIDVGASTSKAAFDVLNFANAFNANGTVTVNDSSTVKLSADLGVGLATIQVQNSAATLTSTSGSSLNLDVATTQGNAIKTGDQVNTLKLSTASATTAVSLADLQADAKTTAITLTGAKDLTVTKLTAAADDLVFSATGFTGKLNLTNETGNKFVIVGGENNDTISLAGTTSAKAGSVAQGGAGNDTLTAGTNAAVLSGGTGNDTITGGAAADTINGGDGDDVITGKELADVLTGGAGADKFVIDPDVKNATAATAIASIDSITDFVGGTDKIMLASNNTNAVAAIADLRTLAAADQAKVNAAANVVLAATEAFTSVGAAYKAAASGVVIFNYGTDTYAVIETAGIAAFDSSADYLVKITGVTGTLAATDFLIS